MHKINRIHHLTAIGGPAQENYDFYHQVLGLRLVKQTVNFDDEETYHFYFANQAADEGTILTFFPWENDKQGRKGGGQVGRMAFSIPKGSLDYWRKRLENHQVEVQDNDEFGTAGIAFEDSHTVRLALIESDKTASENDILGFFGAELLSINPAESHKQLIEELGLSDLGDLHPDYHTLETLGEEKHRIIIPKEKIGYGRLGIGTVHHIAWSMPTPEDLNEYLTFFKNKKYNVTQVKDRKYFESIYVRDQGKVLYEFATDGPGFAVDEPEDKLGQKLMLPDQFESQRSEIEAKLPKLVL